MLPERKAVGRLGDEFVEARLRALRRFAARLAALPELLLAPAGAGGAGGAGGAVLRQFLSLPADAFAALREARSGSGATAAVGAAATAAGKNVFSFMKSVAKDVSAAANAATGGRVGSAAGGGSGAGGAGGAGAKPKSAEDLSFEEVEAYVQLQAPLVTVLYNRAAGAAVRAREQAQLLLEYGAALRALGAAEGGALGGSLSSAGLAVWADSTAHYEAAVAESELLVERLADVVRGIRAAKELLAERSRASGALYEALSAVEAQRARTIALASAPSAAAAAAKPQADADLAAAQVAVTTARDYYNRVAASVITEVDRYRVSLRADFRAMLLDIVHTHARQAAKLQAGWEASVALLSAAVTQEGAQPLAALPAALSADEAARQAEEIAAALPDAPAGDAPAAGDAPPADAAAAAPAGEFAAVC